VAAKSNPRLLTSNPLSLSRFPLFLHLDGTLFSQQEAPLAEYVQLYLPEDLPIMPLMIIFTRANEPVPQIYLAGSPVNYLAWPHGVKPAGAARKTGMCRTVALHGLEWRSVTLSRHDAGLPWYAVW
jgi:hypothetical protein